MKISDQSVSERIYYLINHIEANYHEHILKEWKSETEKRGMAAFPSLSMLECHVIAYIGDKNRTNAVSIAKQLKLTRGGISKLNRRLINKGLIESYKVEGNKRELFYMLTPAGKNVYLIHRSLHEKAEASLLKMISRYSETEKEVIQRFIDDLTEHV